MCYINWYIYLGTFLHFSRYTNLKEESEASSIQISNAEPIDSIVDGASALALPTIASNSSILSNNTADENFYSVPAVSVDNALTEYTFVKEVKVMAASANRDPPLIPKPTTHQQNPHSNLIGNDPDLEIYSAASTLSLGETVILSDGWLNRTPPPNSSSASASNSRTNAEGSSESDFILTLDVDTTASVI